MANARDCSLNNNQENTVTPLTDRATTVSQKAARLADILRSGFARLRFLHKLDDAREKTVRARVLDLDDDGAFAVNSPADDGLPLLFGHRF